MKIGDLAARAGTQVETIRYYERENLLPAPSRSTGNYRQYDDAHVERLSFIRHCRALDMTLEEIRTLLRFKDDPASHCGEVNDLLEEHIGHVTERIGELRSLEEQLKALRSLCTQVNRVSDCGILKGLSQASVEVSRSTKERGAHADGVHGRPRRARGPT
ncbi:MAG: Cd(II)/Pb(II)-responsive transcriptional regulator [Burkholderiaceae bacterium]